MERTEERLTRGEYLTGWRGQGFKTDTQKQIDENEIRVYASDFIDCINRIMDGTNYPGAHELKLKAEEAAINAFTLAMQAASIL